MKKQIIFIMFLLLVCLLTGCSSNEFIYEIKNNGIIITKYNGSKRNLIIPETIEEMDVIAIDHYAFSENTKLKRVTIPSSVHSINDSAFNGCTRLKTVVLSEGIKFIGSNAFSNCFSLKDLNIPNSVLQIGESAFEHSFELPTERIDDVLYYDGWAIACYSNNVIIQDGTKGIANIFFSHRSLESIIIPGSIEHIPDYFFSHCDNLKTVIMKDGILSIGSRAFDSCDKLENVTFPETLTVIGEYAFASRNKLTTLTLPRDLQIIKSFAFFKCSYLTNIVFGNKLKVIESFSFDVSSELASPIILPSSLEIIQDNAFYLRAEKSEVFIPASVQYIGKNAISGPSITYYCEMAEQPVTWDLEWYATNIENPIIWNHKHIE